MYNNVKLSSELGHSNVIIHNNQIQFKGGSPTISWSRKK
jgi:hypothetical protein